MTLEISTNNTDVAGARESSITIPAGSTTGTFHIDAHTVATSSDVQVTVLQRGVAAINSTLRVTIFPPVARFTMSSSSRGDSKCNITDENGNYDCVVDASSSSGVARYFRWSFSIGGGSSDTDVKADATAQPDVSDGCAFFKDHSTNDDNGDKYLNVDVGLVVEDVEGTQSSKTTKTIRFYPSGHCGY